MLKKYEHPNVEIRLTPKPLVLTERFDLALIDGPIGTVHMSRIESVKAAEGITNLILIHDAKRNGERETIQYLTGKGWEAQKFSSDRGLVALRLKD
jgi:hypothetical protein